MIENNCKIVFIQEDFFKDNAYFIEMLDPKNLKKQTNRGYMFLNFTYENNEIFIPLRSNLPDFSKFGKIGFRVPSKSKPNAGLDYRKMLIINDKSYILFPQNGCIPKSQITVINSNYEKIKKEVINYISGYIKSVLKNRHKKDKKFMYSTLHNFHEELGINTLETKEIAIDINSVIKMKDIEYIDDKSLV